MSGKSAITMTEDARHPGIIDHCSAVNGGGIYVKAGELDLAGGHIEDCHATENGGAIYDITTDRMMISGVTIIGHKDLPELSTIFMTYITANTTRPVRSCSSAMSG